MALILQGAGVSHDLSIVRDASTAPPEFRAAVRRIGLHLAVEASRHLPTYQTTVTTPLAEAPCQRIKGDVILVPVLRAGLGLLDAFLDVLPMSRVGFEGLRRNEDDLTAEQYYQRIPDGDATSTYVVIDPMLATGGSLAATVEALLERPHHAIIATCLIASQPGLDAFERRFPSVRLVVADVDNHLNDKGFIVPGLGDAGDRLFGT